MRGRRFALGLGRRRRSAARRFNDRRHERRRVSLFLRRAPRLATPCEQLLWRQAVAARDMASPNVFLEILRDNRRLRSTTVKLRQVLEAARKGKGQIRIGRRAPVRAGQSRSRRRS
jgi:hypothetical protein